MIDQSTCATITQEPSLLEVSDLSIEFSAKGMLPFAKKKTHKAVSQISFSIARSEIVALVGESGSGKSTLGRALLRLIQPAGGTIRMEGRDINGAHSATQERHLRNSIQFVFQDPYTSFNPQLTLGASVAEPLVVQSSMTHDERLRRVREVFEMVKLPDSFIGRYPNELSGGQRQRAVIARALTTRPKLIIADEPTSALDVSIQADIVNLFMDMRDNLGISFLFITHDLAVAKSASDRILVLFGGKIVESGTPEGLFRRPYHPYTQTIIDCLPSAAFRSTRRPSLIDPSEAVAGHAACVFYARCQRREALGSPPDCLSVVPRLDLVERKHLAACHYANARIAA